MEYAKLVELYEKLEKTPSRLDKVEMIASFIENLNDEDLKMAILLLQGRVFPKWSEKEIGLAAKTAAKIISSASGISERVIMKEFSESGDLGLVAEKSVGRKTQTVLFSKKLTLRMVFDNFRRLAETEGTGSTSRKMNLVTELISSASPKEAKYIIRTITEDLRIGVAEGVVRDAIAQAWFADVEWLGNTGKKDRIAEIFRKSKKKAFIFDEPAVEKVKKVIGENDFKVFSEENKIIIKAIEALTENMLWKREGGIDFIITADDAKGSALAKKITGYIEWAWFLNPDYSEVAIIAKNKGIKGLKEAKIVPGRPLQVLLAEKAESIEDAIKSFENAAIEIKYDGMRTQIHKDGEKVWLFTRRLENVTPMFPDIVQLVKNCVKAEKCVLEGESIGIDPKSGKPVPFQKLSQRIHRKYDIHRLKEEIPVQVNLFDIIYLEGDMLFKKPFRDRRKMLESVVEEKKGKFQLAEHLITKNLDEAQKFYQNALAMGQEGVMVKNLDAPYQPGKRVAGGWLKVKPIMETLDLVVTGAVWGTGKRAGWFGSFILSCVDKDGNFLECGMMGTGIKEKKTSDDDVTFKDLTEMIKPDIIKEKDNMVFVKPKIVLEIAYEEIQKSPNYASGFALRFPRLVRVRYDRGPEDCDTIERVKELFSRQKRGHDINVTVK